MSKSISYFILLALSLFIHAAFAKLRRIPSPVLTETRARFLSRDSKITLNGTGFIKGFNNAHKVYLKKGKKRFKLRTISSTQESIELEIPENIKYGDYDLYIYLKTRFFKSKKRKYAKLIRIRPQAPEKAELKYQAITDLSELEDLSDLRLELSNELKLGENQVKAYSIEDGFESLRTQAMTIYYLPQKQLEKELEIISQKPLTSQAKSLDAQIIDTSKITKSHELNLTRSFFIETPHQARYLEAQIQLNPIYIAKAHVKNPEYLILKNRSQESFSLAACHIEDALKTRFEFTSEVLAAQAEFKLEANLGLNDTGDEIKLYCAGELLEKLRFDALDGQGFAKLD